MDYFQEVVDSLDTNEFIILTELYKHDSINTFQSVSKQQLLSNLNMTDFIFRKAISRLENLLLIAVVKSSRFYRYHLTKNGLLAINKITEGALVE